MNGEELIRSAIKGGKHLNDMEDGVVIKKGGEVKKKKQKDKCNKIEFPDSIEKWTIPHLVRFSHNKFKERYGKTWELNFSAQCNEILKISDCFVDVLGFCSNDILKKYIEWFFNNMSDFFMEKKGGFYFSYLYREKVLNMFLKNSKFSYQEQEYDNEEYDNLDGEKIKVDNVFSDMENTFLLSNEDFVSRYGVIIVVNWLVDKKKFSIKDAIHYAYLACSKIHSKGMFDKVIKSTVKYGPYPGRLKFLNASKIYEKVNPLLSIDVDITLSDSRIDLPI